MSICARKDPGIIGTRARVSAENRHAVVDGIEGCDMPEAGGRSLPRWEFCDEAVALAGGRYAEPNVIEISVIARLLAAEDDHLLADGIPDR